MCAPLDCRTPPDPLSARLMSMHSNRFPGESAKYRAARDELLRAENELIRRTWEIAELRRGLPLGGELKEDYVFEEGPSDLSLDQPAKKTRFSDLFPAGKDTLVLYSYMYGPDMEEPCPMCTSMLSGLHGDAVDASQRVGLAVVAKSPIARIRAFARIRGWKNFRLLSSARTTYNLDYHGESPDGDQLPSLNVFVRRDGKIHHFYHTEALFAPAVEGADSCHVDAIWPLWGLFDMTPNGRGDFYPQLSY